MLVYLSNKHEDLNLNFIIFCPEADPANWSIPKEKIPEGINGGEGGFLPYGFAGMYIWYRNEFSGFF